MRFDYYLICLLIRSLAKLFFGLQIKGMENLPRQGRLLIAANHQSYLDPPLLGASIPREIHYMAKAQLFRKALLGPLIRHLNAIPVTRSGQDLASIRLAGRILENEGALLVFPEGTRSRTGTFLKATGGLGLLARQTQAPVLPIYIHGTHGFWRRPFRSGRLKITCGQALEYPPANVNHSTGAEAYRAFSELVMQKIAELKAANSQKR